jgi:hypothetical protein
MTNDATALPMETMNQLRDLAISAIAEHEKAEHDGQPCPLERINLVAWLCHCLGVDKPDYLLGVVKRVREYQHYHTQEQHHHGH